METAHISKGGQISIPAAIRRRWATTEVLVEDLGDSVLLRPMPADPISAARGALGGARVSLEVARSEERIAEAERERTRFARRHV